VAAKGECRAGLIRDGKNIILSFRFDYHKKEKQRAMIIALSVIGFCTVLYVVISSLYMGEQRNTIRGQDEYIDKLEHKINREGK